MAGAAGLDRDRATRPGVRASIPALLALAVLSAVAGSAAAQPGGGRLRPPDGIACTRDHLTVYAGVVQRYVRGTSRTELRIHTDEDTVEDVVILHPKATDASARYRIEGAAFTPEDWPRIEVRAGTLHADMRAAAWVCDDGNDPVVDWHPPTGP